MSPDVGEIDEAVVEQGLVDDPDEMLALLADLTSAADQRLRDVARRLAARLFLDLARRGPTTKRKAGRISEQPYRPDGGDLDLDASFDVIAEARAAEAAVDAERLRIRSWGSPETALCLLVDRSGSMGGRPLATAAVAAAAVAMRNPANYSVVAFGKETTLVKAQMTAVPADRVVTDVLSLRGHGTTDLAGALRAASAQLQRSGAPRQIAIVLSDCRSTVAGDVRAAAATLPEIVVVAPEHDCEEALKFAGECGARIATASGPSTVVEALASVLDR